MERLVVQINDSDMRLNEEKERLLKIPGYSLPVFLALNATFPKGINPERVKESYKRVNDLTPVLVAVNEYADIGLSAERKIRQGVSQDKFMPLHLLSSGLGREFGKRLARLKEKYLGDENIDGLETVLDDFILLSQERLSFNQGEIPLYQELDSGIIETSYVVWAFPGILELVGFNPTERTSTIDDLKRKYKVFDLSKTDTGANHIAKKLQGIHAVEMCLKIDDDLDGASVDRKLGIPNFTDWEKGSDGRSLKSLRRHYMDIARKSGIPNFLTSTARLASYVRGIVKDRNAGNGIIPTDDYFEVSDYAGGRKFGEGCNTLRQKLVASGLLNELFR